MNKSLTWQQVIVGLLLLPLMIVSILAFTPDVARRTQNAAQFGFVIIVASILALIIWHTRVNNRPDVHPDILALITPKNAIFQAGNAAHFWIGARQARDNLIVTCFLQNLFDVKVFVDLKLPPDRGAAYIGLVPDLATTLSPAQVTLATLTVPLRPPDRPTEVRFVLSVSARLTDEGTRVRFARRQGITKKVSPAITGALLLTGTLMTGGGTFLNVQLQPFAPTGEKADPTFRTWDVTSVWEIGDPTDAKSIQQAIS